MSTLENLKKVLKSTEPPKPLLKYFPNGEVIPMYMFEAVCMLNDGKYHGWPFSKEEKFQIWQFKLAADVDGSQPKSDEVFRNIHIGNLFAAETPQYLAFKEITHLLNTCGKETEPDCARPNPHHMKNNGIEFLNLEIVDKPHIDVLEYLEISADYIHSALKKGGNVMVSCWQGASRSATMVLAFLVKYEHFDLATALKMVKSKRDIKPNDGFLTQLIKFEEKCNEK